MKCYKCNKRMNFVKGLRFNGYKIDGWKCAACGEEYYQGDQAQRILLLNKLKKEAIKAKLGRIKSNLILRVPKDIELALGLKKGEVVLLKVEDKAIKIIQA